MHWAICRRLQFIRYLHLYLLFAAPVIYVTSMVEYEPERGAAPRWERPQDSGN